MCVRQRLTRAAARRPPRGGTTVSCSGCTTSAGTLTEDSRCGRWLSASTSPTGSRRSAVRCWASPNSAWKFRLTVLGLRSPTYLRRRSTRRSRLVRAIAARGSRREGRSRLEHPRGRADSHPAVPARQRLRERVMERHPAGIPGLVVHHPRRSRPAAAQHGKAGDLDLVFLVAAVACCAPLCVDRVSRTAC